jgi:hypothetical protein
MSSDRTPESGVANDHSKLWSMPWHARLKDLADTVGPGSVEHVVATLKISPARATLSVPASWLGRARSRAVSARVSV